MKCPECGSILIAGPVLRLCPVCSARLDPERQEHTAVSVGDRVIFGRYPQKAVASYRDAAGYDVLSSFLEADPEPIGWRVLDIICGMAMIMTERLLDHGQYNEQRRDVTWDTCSLRKWLNTDFYELAFNTHERSMIAEAVLHPQENEYGTDGGDPSKNRVFILSVDEAKRYFAGDCDRKAEVTAYAQSNGAHYNEEDGAGCWWLRSPGCRNDLAAAVDIRGGIESAGQCVDSGLCCVRPVVIVAV